MLVKSMGRYHFEYWYRVVRLGKLPHCIRNGKLTYVQQCALKASRSRYNLNLGYRELCVIRGIQRSIKERTHTSPKLDPRRLP